MMCHFVRALLVRSRINISEIVRYIDFTYLRLPLAVKEGGRIMTNSRQRAHWQTVPNKYFYLEAWVRT